MFPARFVFVTLQRLCGEPAIGVVGGFPFITIFTLLVLGVHVPFEIVQPNVYVPIFVNDTLLVGEIGAVIVGSVAPLGLLIKDQLPTPFTGALPVKAVLKPQIF